MKPLRACSTLLLSLLFTTPLWAQNQFNLDTLQSGQLVLNLNTSDQREVEQDTLNARLEFILQGRDRIALQDQLNASMAQALELIKSTSIESNTSNYQAYIAPDSFTSANNSLWEVRQGVILTSTDSAALLELAGKLQELGLTMSALYYSLSTARYEAVTEELTTQALGTLQQRAEAAARALGKSKADLVEVSMNGSYNFGLNREYSDMAMVSSAAPVADPGKTQVSVNLSARAVLSP
ncbi:MAG: SIMPL domain-containing protein [Pseudomonadales bacterium]|jgi:predicted secreted protein|nr:SIMPL domain-containing protein [Pseudomonadales bacterium]